MVFVGVCFSSYPASLLFISHMLHMAYAGRIKASVGSPINLLVEGFGTGPSGLMLISKDDTLTGVALQH